jgi:hypothetical protein
MRRRCVNEPGLNIGDGVVERAATFARSRRLDGARQLRRVTPRRALLRAAKPAPHRTRCLPRGASGAVFAEATLASRAWLRRALDEAPHGRNGVASAGYRLVAVRLHGALARVPPRAPRFSASIVDGRVRVTWEDAVETGSGVAHYDIRVDGGAAVRFGADLTQEPIVVGRALPGQHTVRVVAVDRAGNRSQPAVRRIEAQ